jgi:UDP-2,3-diacylglucosamine hydrolase
MTELRKTIFISDLHLDKNQPQITQHFLTLLHRLDSSVDALYILGDLFEAWIGDDDGVSQYANIITALRTVTQRDISIYFLYGNRDFLVGKQFFRDTGCQLLTDESKIELYGQTVLLMHGDTLCTRDIAYINMRKKLRNRFIQKLFLLLPLSLRRKIASEMREKSRLYTSIAASDIMDVTQDEVLRVMQKHRVSCLIHGHTHKPYFHEFLLQQIPMTRIVLSDWHNGGSMLVWDESGKKEMIKV